RIFKLTHKRICMYSIICLYKRNIFMKFCHINHDKTRLLIFFCGFYTDENCFAEFDNNTSDILFIYDYSYLDFEEISYFDFSPYVEINLIAYSYGVFAA